MINQRAAKSSAMLIVNADTLKIDCGNLQLPPRLEAKILLRDFAARVWLPARFCGLGVKVVTRQESKSAGQDHRSWKSRDTLDTLIQVGHGQRQVARCVDMVQSPC